MSTSIAQRRYYHPATLFASFAADDKDIAAVTLGEDLIAYVGHRAAAPDGNDANEHFNHDAVQIDLFDCDYNYLGSVGQFRSHEDAMATLPAMIPVIRELYPNHVINPDGS